MRRHLRVFRCCASSSSAAAASPLSTLCAPIYAAAVGIYLFVSLLLLPFPLSKLSLYLSPSPSPSVCCTPCCWALTEVKSFENLPLMKLKEPLIVAPYHGTAVPSPIPSEFGKFSLVANWNQFGNAATSFRSRSVASGLTIQKFAMQENILNSLYLHILQSFIDII